MSDTLARKEEERMAKVQKSVLLDEDLVRLIDAVEKRSGASFTRIVTASLLQYLFTRPEGPDPLWMEHVVEIALEEREVGELPVIRQSIDVQMTYRSNAGTHAAWGRLIKQKGDDPIQKILDHWAKS